MTVGKFSEFFCTVLCTTVVQLYAHTCEQFLLITTSLRLRLTFVYFRVYF